MERSGDGEGLPAGVQVGLSSDEADEAICVCERLESVQGDRRRRERSPHVAIPVCD